MHVLEHRTRDVTSAKLKDCERQMYPNHELLGQ